MNSHTLKNLNLLKKISLQKSDLLRLKMRDHLNEIDELKMHSKKIIEQRVQEEEFAAQGEHMGCNLALDAYRAKQQNQIKTNERLGDDIEKSYSVLREQLSDLFSEQKSYEITIDDLQKKETAREKQEELHHFDEVSIQRWKKK